VARLGSFDVAAADIGWMDRAMLEGGWFSEETFPAVVPQPLAVDATSILGIIEAIAAELYAQMIDEAAPLAPVLPDVAFGESQIEVYAKPRIVFVPIRGTHKQTRSLGGTPGRLWDRNLQFEVHVRSGSKDECDELASRLVAAMHECLTADSYEMGGEIWDGDEMTGPPGQQLMILIVTLRGSFTRRPDRTTQPTNFVITGGIQQEDN
jgi:hypothetical protein